MNEITRKTDKVLYIRATKELLHDPRFADDIMEDLHEIGRKYKINIRTSFNPISF